MTLPMGPEPSPGVRAHAAGRLLRRIETVRARVRETERRVPLEGFGRNRESARNLLHYLALREFDLRGLQDGLADLGLSSLGRAEGHVLYNLDAVRAQLAPMAHRSLRPELAPPAVSPEEGRRLLGRHAAQLFGRAPAGRSTRIMVTLPAEAAEPRRMGRLAAAGMDLARINCAHDAPAVWDRMIRQVRAVDRRTGTRHRIEMDLGGPRLRTGPLPPRPVVLKAVPERDDRGRRLRPARIELVPQDGPEPAARPGVVSLRVPRAWLDERHVGERISLRDSRGRSRHLTVRARRRGTGRLSVEARKSVWFANGVRLRAAHAGRAPASVALDTLPSRPGRLRLERGDRLLLGRREGVPARSRRAQGPNSGPAIGAIPAAAIDAVRPGEPVWFDGGRIGGIAMARTAEGIVVRIDHIAPGGAWLRGDQGINLPDTHLTLPPLSATDRQHLRFIAAHADLVGYSFVQTADDVEMLREELRRLGRPRMGIVLKIETRRAFEELPAILLSALRSGPTAVMLARGDLAVEVGFERLAEVQEELLWLCEAAHVPAIWATQVLEGLAQSGLPARAEVTDAAMGERAECVMLNKGPYLEQAVAALDSIVRRMQAHQAKKSPRLRHLNVAERFLRAPPARPPAPVPSTAPPGARPRSRRNA